MTVSYTNNAALMHLPQPNTAFPTGTPYNKLTKIGCTGLQPWLRVCRVPE